MSNEQMKRETWQEVLMRVLDTHISRRNALNVPLELTLPYDAVVALKGLIEREYGGTEAQAEFGKGSETAFDGDRRLFEVKMTHNGRTVTISYDPSDPEAVQAAEAWREALFAEPLKDAEPIAAHVLNMLDVAVKASDPQTEYYRGFRNALRYAAYLTDGKEPQYEGPTWFDSENPAADMTELEKAVKPLRDYLKAHGDPHTSVIVTQDGATETQDERRVTFRDCLNQAVCKADERYDLKALKPQTSVKNEKPTRNIMAIAGSAFELQEAAKPLLAYLDKYGCDEFTGVSVSRDAAIVGMNPSNDGVLFSTHFPRNGESIKRRLTKLQGGQFWDMLSKESMGAWADIAREYEKLSDVQKDGIASVSICADFVCAVRHLSDRLTRDLDEASKAVCYGT